MSATDGDGPIRLAAQLQHQLRLARTRTAPWIQGIFVLGLGVSFLGLVPALIRLREQGTVTLALVFATATAFFGWAVVASLVWPYLLRPRIVPYFPRALGPLHGPTMAAFARGRALYRKLDTLDALAGRLAVTPLSAFGFADDYYDQDVAWYPAADGLRTTEALRGALSAEPDALDAGVPGDLDALASVLRVAAEQRVDFALVLRLHAKDSLQGVMTREVRHGSFW